MRRVISVLLAFACATASAQNAPVNVMGSGLDSCGSLTQAYTQSPSNIEWPGTPSKRPKSDAYLEWMLGYVAAAQMRKNVTLSTDYSGIEEWVKRYCTAHPEHSVLQAIMAFDRAVIK